MAIFKLIKVTLFIIIDILVQWESLLWFQIFFEAFHDCASNDFTYITHQFHTPLGYLTFLPNMYFYVFEKLSCVYLIVIIAYITFL